MHGIGDRVGISVVVERKPHDNLGHVRQNLNIGVLNGSDGRHCGDGGIHDFFGPVTGVEISDG